MKNQNLKNRLYLIILNRFIWFISTHYNFTLFRKNFAHFATQLTAQDTSKLTGNERNACMCTTQSSRKGMMLVMSLKAGWGWTCNINPLLEKDVRKLIFLKHCLASHFDGIIVV